MASNAGGFVASEVSGFVAPVAAHAGAVTDRPDALAVARSVIDAFSAQPSPNGLTVGEIQDRCGAHAAEVVAGRVRVFVALGMLEPTIRKGHIQRYTLNLAGLAGQRVFERLAADGGVGELLAILDRAMAEVTRQHSTPQTLTVQLDAARPFFEVMTSELDRLVERGTLDELIATRSRHDHTELLGVLRTLVDLISGEHPELEPVAFRVLTEAQRYERALTRVVERIIDEGGRARDFALMAPEAYLGLAITGRPEVLAGLVDHVLFDAGVPAVTAGDVVAAVLDHVPRRRGRRDRPPSPEGNRDADPVAEQARRATEATRSRSRRVLALVGGRSRRVLTGKLRSMPWRDTAGALADLITATSDHQAGWKAEVSGNTGLDPETGRYFFDVTVEPTGPAGIEDGS